MNFTLRHIILIQTTSLIIILQKKTITNETFDFQINYLKCSSREKNELLTGSTGWIFIHLYLKLYCACHTSLNKTGLLFFFFFVYCRVENEKTHLVQGWENINFLKDERRENSCLGNFQFCSPHFSLFSGKKKKFCYTFFTAISISHTKWITHIFEISEIYFPPKNVK